MSADNWIYIAKFPDGYRVAHAMAIENVDYYPENSIDRKIVLKGYFGKSKVHTTIESAVNAAKEIEAKEWWTEYWICEIGEYESFEGIPNVNEKRP